MTDGPTWRGRDGAEQDYKAQGAAVDELAKYLADSSSTAHHAVQRHGCIKSSILPQSLV